jgi:hypothetical protein
MFYPTHLYRRGSSNQVEKVVLGVYCIKTQYFERSRGSPGFDLRPTPNCARYRRYRLDESVRRLILEVQPVPATLLRAPAYAGVVIFKGCIMSFVQNVRHMRELLGWSRIDMLRRLCPGANNKERARASQQHASVNRYTSLSAARNCFCRSPRFWVSRPIFS